MVSMSVERGNRNGVIREGKVVVEGRREGMVAEDAEVKWVKREGRVVRCFSKVGKEGGQSGRVFNESG